MRAKIISSLEKCFLEDNMDTKQSVTSGSMLKNENYQFQICYTMKMLSDGSKFIDLKVNSPISDYITLYKIQHVAVKKPVYNIRNDNDYLSKRPGLFPDLLTPLYPNNMLVLSNNLESVFVEISPCGKVPAGVYPIEIVFTDHEKAEVCSELKFDIEIIDAELPEQSLIYTRWFYSDCLQAYYRTESFDERHWEIIENFMRTAVKRGMNMVLTPLFTPALDTAMDAERPTTQLVDIYVNNGEYTFDFSKLGRWIDLCDRVGIKYLEISHLFRNQGARFACKVAAYVDGEYRKIFGSHTRADSDEYTSFLKSLIPKLLDYLKSKNNADKRCYFHISDEPHLDELETYKAARKVVADLLGGYPIIDALSDYEFVEEGIADIPIPQSDCMMQFINNNVPGLWTYYCGWQAVDVSNCFIAMSSARNRIIGTQLYKYNIKGFLHWGYNFYFSKCSYGLVNPYLLTASDYFAPAGDSFIVYPAPDGTAYESLRHIVFSDALQDIRAFQLCEKLYGRDYVMNLIEKSGEITFKKYPSEPSYLLNLREQINQAIKNKLTTAQ